MAKLKDELAPQRWHNNQHVAAINTLFTAQWLKERLAQELAKYNITLQQYYVLRILRSVHPDGISSAEIRKRMMDDSSDISRIISRLVKLKYVRRKASKADKRVTEIHLTFRGLELIGQLRGIDRFYKSKLTKALTEEEAQLLSALLDKVRTC